MLEKLLSVMILKESELANICRRSLPFIITWLFFFVSYHQKVPQVLGRSFCSKLRCHSYLPNLSPWPFVERTCLAHPFVTESFNWLLQGRTEIRKRVINLWPLEAVYVGSWELLRSTEMAEITQKRRWDTCLWTLKKSHLIIDTSAGRLC